MGYLSLRVSRPSAAIIVLFIVIFAVGAAKPLLLDNMDFPAVAARTAQTGLPVYYRGEEKPAALGLYHPPLYIYLLAAWMRVFGSAETSVRMFGLVCALLQGLVVLEILCALFGPRFLRRCMPWFWAVFLLNPYTVQTASIADIDSTIYGPLLCFALLAALRMDWENGVWKETPPRFRDYALLSGILTLCFWAKLTTVLLIFPFLFVLFIPRLGVWRSGVTVLALAAISGGLFYVTYWSYGKATGLNTNFTFEFTWISFVERGTSGTPGLIARLTDYRRNLDFMAPFTIAWTGMLPWGAAACVLIWSGLRVLRLRDRRAIHYGTLLALALLTTVYYCAKVITFGWAPFKYTAVYWGLLLTAPLVLIFDGFDPSNAELVTLAPRPWTVPILLSLTVLVVAPFLFSVAHVQDVLILTPESVWRSMWVIVPAAAFCLGAVGLRWHAPVSRFVMLAALVFVIGFQAGVALFQSKADYATTYDYGQTGFLDTVGFIRSETKPTDIIACMKDIGYRAQRRYVETYLGLYRLYDGTAEEDRLLHSISSGTVRYAIFTAAAHGPDQLVINPRIQAWVAQNCVLVQSFGDYRIYKYKGGS